MFNTGVTLSADSDEFGLEDIEFAVDFLMFERNRMYLPGYRKEPSMKRLTLEHVDSLSRGEQSLMSGITASMSSRHRQSIENDIERLSEVKRYILTVMYQPGLPFTTNIPEHPKPYGDTSRTQP